MTVILDRTKALELLRIVVEENGADTKAICSYTITATNPLTGREELRSECIVGKVMEKVGVPLDTLYEAGKGLSVAGLVEKDAIREYVETGWDAVRVLHEAQVEQDNGGTWGDALTAAEGYERELRRREDAQKISQNNA